MPIAYIPKPIKVINTATIKKLGLNITNLTRSQTKGLDKFITLIKPANKRSDYREDITDLISSYFEYVKTLKAPEVRDSLRSVINQINKGGEYAQEPKGHKFDIGRDVAELLKELTKSN